VNSRNDVDVLDFCDSDGNVEFMLDPADTLVTVPSGSRPLLFRRHVRFLVTFGSPELTEKILFILSIAPDRETVAS
jgi:hypothetical protein